MSSRWMRDVCVCENDDSYIYWHMKAHTVFLQNVMGYTFQSSNCPAGRSFVSTEKNGTGGSFGGADWIFTAPGGSFVQADAGKYLVVRDDTNPRNGGIYRIRRYISGTQVEIDFRSDPYNEWPTASTGITWWVYALGYQAPAVNDYVRLQSRHATGWALEYKAYPIATSHTYIISIRVAIDGDWGGSKILPGGGLTTWIMMYRANGDLGFSSWFVEGDYDGEWLNLWFRNMGDNEQWGCSGVAIGRITPLEPGHSNDDLLFLAGNTNGTYLGNQGFARYYSNDYLRPRVWSTAINAPIDAWWMQPSLGWAANGITEWQIREPNARIGDKFEMAQGTWMCADTGNQSGVYHILGKAKGHYSTKDFLHAFDVSYATGHRHLTLTKNTRKDLLMIQHGWVIAWPGVTPQF